MAKTCDKCGNLITFDTEFCPFCSAELKDKVTIAPRKERRRKKNITSINTGEIMVPVRVDEKKESLKRSEEKAVHVKPQEVVEDNKEVKAKEIKDPVSKGVGIPAPPGKINSTRITNPATVTEEELASEISEIVEEEKADRLIEQEENGNEATVEPEATQEDFGDISEGGDEITETADNDLLKEDNDVEGAADTHSRSKKGKENVKSRKQLEYELMHDSLTNLYNRRAYEQRISQSKKAGLCIISVDANDLKKTNDTIGHEAGDKMLKIIAAGLNEVFGTANAYRIGGDEFCVILTGFNEKEIQDMIAAYRQYLKKKEYEQSGKLCIRAAIGYALGGSSNIGSIQDVIKKADEAMYEDKQKIKAIYNPNYDGYYNDVATEYEEIKVSIDRETVHKAIITIVALVGVIVFIYLFS